MKCLRIYASPDGESHFDEIELPTTKRAVHPEAAPFDVTGSYTASRVRITHIPAGMHEIAWHRVPEPVLTVRLDGSVEYEASDGDVRYVPAGSFVLVEDTLAKAIPGKRRRSSGFRSPTVLNCRQNSWSTRRTAPQQERPCCRKAVNCDPPLYDCWINVG